MKRATALAALGLFFVAACGEEHEPTVASDPVPRYEESIPGTDVRFQMVLVPGAGIWIGRTEVTWDEYEAYFLSKDEDLPPGVDAVSRPTPAYMPHDRGWGTGRRPAIGISRHAAEHYCKWLSRETGNAYRLPTEAEWEAACAAGGTPPAERLGEFAWYVENTDETSEEVGRKQPDALGLHDMLGNAWEYCSGPFSEDDPTPVMRGGCWESPASELTCGARRNCPEAWNDSDAQRPKGKWWLADGPYVGFRVVRPVPE